MAKGRKKRERVGLFIYPPGPGESEYKAFLGIEKEEKRNRRLLFQSTPWEIDLPEDILEAIEALDCIGVRGGYQPLLQVVEYVYSRGVALGRRQIATKS